MADYLPPVVARLSMDIGDFAAKAAEAKAEMEAIKRAAGDVKMGGVKGDAGAAKAAKDAQSILEKWQAIDGFLPKVDDEIRRLGNTSRESFIGGKSAMDDWEKSMAKLKADLTDAALPIRDIEKAMNRMDSPGTTFRLGDAGIKDSYNKIRQISSELKNLDGKEVKVRVKASVDSNFQKVMDFLSKGATNAVTGTAFGRRGGVPAIPVAAMPVLAAGVGALLNEAVGLVAGFSAAGAGALAFYTLAHPAINNLTGDVKALDYANQKLGYAQNAYLIDPTKKNAAALKAAQDQYKAVQMSTGQDAGSAASSLTKLHDAYVKATTAFQPQAFKVFAGGLKVLSNLMPHVTQFATPFAGAMDGLFKKLNQFTTSKGFTDWLKQFATLVGPATAAIGTGFGKVAIAFGKMITSMSAKDVAHAINIAFGAIAGTIGAITATVKFFMQAWDGAGIAISSFAHMASSNLDAVRTTVVGIGHSFASAWNSAQAATGKFLSFLAGMPGQIKGFFAGAAGWLISAGMNLVKGFFGGIKQDWALVSGWLAGINGRITAFFAGAGGWLISAGAAVLNGFLAGLKSAWGGVTSFVSGIAGWIAAHKGPLEADRALLVPAGQAIMDGLNRGLDSRMSALQGRVTGINSLLGTTGAHSWQASSLARSAAAGGAALTVSGDGGVQHIHVHLDGREIYSSIQAQAAAAQRRTGHNGLTKRSR